MKVLVTGGSGFLGGYVIKQLIADGHEVQALARSPAAKGKVEALGATPLFGDLSKPDGFVAHLKWVDAIIHCAAPVVFWESWDFYKKNLVDTTLHLVQAASRAGVKRFVQVSSESVLQSEGPLSGIDESFPYPQEPNSNYGKAKRDLEHYLRSAPFKMETIIVRPPFVWGPECPAFETISEKARAGKFMWVDEGKAHFEAIHVENLASAISLALTKGQNRQVYIVTDNQPYSVRSFFSKFFTSNQIAAPTKSMPLWLATLLARSLEKIWKAFKIKKAPPLSLFELAFVSMPRRYNIAKANRELGYTPKVFL